MKILLGELVPIPTFPLELIVSREDDADTSYTKNDPAVTPDPDADEPIQYFLPEVPVAFRATIDSVDPDEIMSDSFIEDTILD